MQSIMIRKPVAVIIDTGRHENLQQSTKFHRGDAKRPKVNEISKGRREYHQKLMEFHRVGAKITEMAGVSQVGVAHVVGVSPCGASPT